MRWYKIWKNEQRLYNTLTEKISFLEYNFFKYEDRSDINIYSLKKLKAETRKMEKTKAFKNLIKKIKNVIIIIIIILISFFFIVMKKLDKNQQWRLQQWKKQQLREKK